jgi:hypothetical protein
MRGTTKFLPVLVLATATLAAGPVAVAGDGGFGLGDAAGQMRRQCAQLLPNASSAQAACMRIVREAFDQLRSPYDNTVQSYDPADEARKARRHIETGYRDPAAVDLCPPPRRMSAENGCK